MQFPDLLCKDETIHKNKLSSREAQAELFLIIAISINITMEKHEPEGNSGNEAGICHEINGVHL